MFLIRVLEEIANDKECKKPTNSQLKELCQAAIEELKSNSELSSQLTTLPDLLAPIDYNRYFEPFELATLTGCVRLIQLSLDSIQKLIAHGHLLGKCPDPRNPNRRLIDRIVKVVCDCFNREQTNEGVQLQILKALLTILTSQLVDVHQGTLLLAVKTCFNICLISKSAVNQTTAKATLTQILNVVFFKMEQEAAMLRRTNEARMELSEEKDQSDSQESNASSDADAEIVSLMDELIHRVEYSESERGEISLSELGRRKRSSFEGLDMATEFQKDAYYIINSLCKISQRSIIVQSGDTRVMSSLDYRSKVLSLQLLLSILQNPGPELRTNPIYLTVVRSQLCLSLTNNVVSGLPTIFELAIAVFVALLASFKQHLKVPTEVFFREVLLPVLDSPNSSFQHKLIVLQALRAICANRQIILDIYINYDCSMRCSNLLEKLVFELSRIAHGRSAADLGCSTAQDEQLFRRKGLECLVAILESMKEWALGAPDIVDSHSSKSRSNSEVSLPSLQINGKQSEDYDPAEFEAVKNIKNIVEYGIDVFNQKPSRGLQFLQHNNIVSSDPEDIARFLHTYEEKLDKTVVGEFLGSGERWNKEVMFAYVDQMDFTSLSFLTALRSFLSGFRLPGEAQKIDRLMEKFAARFCECNQSSEIFSSADTAYVLAYSIIMLTTDLHSSQVKQKMTKEQYINLNKGINESRDLPVEYLSKIYDEIASEEIKMKYPDKDRRTKPIDAKQRHRKLLFNLEMGHIHQIAKSLLENAASWSAENFMTASHASHVGPMFKVLWSPCLAAFSVGLQDSNDDEIVRLCLKGTSLAILIAGVFHQRTERNAFLQSLIRFTSLKSVSTTEVNSKNIKCIRALIDTAFLCGNYLDKSWTEVIKCISQVESVYMQKSMTTEELSSNRVHQNNRNIFDNIDTVNNNDFFVAIDRVFTNSINFNGDSIVDFVRSLCIVSSDELSQKPPRTYCLQKILEISYYNMDRVRLQWSRTWIFVADHIVKACSSKNNDVATFALDSLRQLAVKFLEKDELTNFHFQKDFLRPFGIIMRKNNSTEIRDLLLRCVLQLINSQARNIRSGWKNLLGVIMLGASDPKKDIVDLSFHCISRITEDLMEPYFYQMTDAIPDCIKCLTEFASCAESVDIASDALRLLLHLADQVNRHSEAFKEQYSDEVVGFAVDDRIWVRAWLPILFEGCSVADRCRSNTRSQAIFAIFEILTHYGQGFKQSWWEEAFTVIFRLFERSPETEQARLEWSTTTCTQLIHCLTDLYCSANFSVLRVILLTRLCPLFVDFIFNGHIEVARGSMRCIEKLAFGCCERLDEVEWNILLDCVISLIDSLDSKESATNLFRNREMLQNNGEPPGDSLSIRDELVQCLIGIFHDRSASEQREHYLKRLSKFYKQSVVLCEDEIPDTATKVFRNAPKGQLSRVLDAISHCLQTSDEFDNSDILRIVTASWMEFELAKRSQLLNKCLFRCTNACLNLLISLEKPNAEQLIARDRAYSELSTLLLDVYMIKDKNTFIRVVIILKQVLCWSIAVVTDPCFRFMTSQIFRRYIDYQQMDT